MIALNVGALVDLSRAFIETLTAADNGVLINVASLLGFQPTPYLGVYGATKAFVLSFTEGAVGGDPRHRAARPRRLPRSHADRVLRHRRQPDSRLRRKRCNPEAVVRTHCNLRPSLRTAVGDHERPPDRARQQVAASPPGCPAHGPIRAAVTAPDASASGTGFQLSRPWSPTTDS